jgi:hypothetical protein
MIKKFLAILITITLLMGIGGTVIAQDIQPGYLERSGEYNFNGDIVQSIHVGSDKTGSQQKVEITGKGSFSRISYLIVQNNTLTVTENSNWQTDMLSKAWESLALLSVIKLGASPSVNHPTEQIFAVYLELDKGEYGKLYQSFIGTSKREDLEYIDSFDIDFESFASKGITKRFIDISGEISEAYLSDHLRVNGYAEIRESLQFYDEVIPVQLGVGNWYEIF